MITAILANLETFTPAMFYIILLPLIIWETIWKAFGLWHSARDNKKVWFILILILNTMGILPMVYLFLIRKRKKKK